MYSIYYKAVLPLTLVHVKNNAYMHTRHALRSMYVHTFSKIPKGLTILRNGGNWHTVTHCCSSDILINVCEEFQQTRRKSLFNKSRTGLKYIKARIGVGTMEKRMIMPFAWLMARFTSVVGEPTYAAITGVDWPMALSMFPRRRKVETSTVVSDLLHVHWRCWLLHKKIT